MACGPSLDGVDTGMEVLRSAPEVVDFGRRDLGTTTALSVELVNAGTEPVALDLWLGGTSFQLLREPPRPLRLEPDASWSVDVLFMPTRSLHRGSLLARTVSSPEGLLEVLLVGEGRDPLAER